MPFFSAYMTITEKGIAIIFDNFPVNSLDRLRCSIRIGLLTYEVWKYRMKMKQDTNRKSSKIELSSGKKNKRQEDTKLIS